MVNELMHGIVWPDVPAATPAAALPIADELERTQWWSPDDLRAAQQRQLASLVAHATATVPHYRDGTDRVMTRADIVAADLLSRAYPSSHGLAPEVTTSRTTGAPVRVRGTGVVGALNAALTLRDHRAHRRDLTASLAALRYAPSAPPPDGASTLGWSPAMALLAPDAPVHVLSIIGSTTEQQLAWVVRTDPVYFLTYPSVLDGVLRRMTKTGARVPSLREVRTVGERLAPETRALAAEVLGVPLADTYSAQEVGPIAFQCPDSALYHVQAERFIVEVLRADGAPCAAGETGRVVITDLHNFATPILRYDIGDLAEVGSPCPCGRGLPTLARIVGRSRDLLIYPDGKTVYPVFAIACRKAARFHAIQLVQPDPSSLVLRVVPDGAVDAPALIAALQRALSHPFAVSVEVVDEIARTPAGKLAEFVSLIPPR